MLEGGGRRGKHACLLACRGSPCGGAHLVVEERVLRESFQQLRDFRQPGQKHQDGTCSPAERKDPTNQRRGREG